MITEYKTITLESEIELIEKKSRFIGYARPVETEEEAICFVDKVRHKHADATHNVYAYLTRRDNITRFSDDGEPSGTAGLPTLDALRKAGFTDAAVVVTRYFGGTLLGTGGLVRAYGNAATKALTAAQPVIRKLSHLFSVSCGYDLSGSVQYTLNTGGYIIENTAYTDKVEFTVGVPFGWREAFEQELISVTAGRIKMVHLQDTFVNAEYFLG